MPLIYQLGRIGLAISPVNPDVLYANVEAANAKGGIFRSSDNGVTWERRADYNAGAMYYGDIFPAPADVDRDQPRIEPHAQPSDDDARAAVSNRIRVIQCTAIHSETARRGGRAGDREGAGTAGRAVHAGSGAGK